MSAACTLVAVALLCASSAGAECLPSGRSTFAAGLEALGRGDLEEAHGRFDELVKAQPDCAEARNNLAVVLFEQGRFEEADAQLRRAVELNPDYQRARFNLRRVEAGSREQQRAKPDVETAIAGEVTLTPGVPSVQAPLPAPAATPLAQTPPVSPAAGGPDVPGQLAVIEPDGMAACVIEPARRRICVFRRAGASIVVDACYPMTGMQVQSWPPWTATSDVTPKRIRLVDQRRQRRLRVVPESAPTDDSVRLGQHDFDELSAKVVPWRTSWVVVGAARESAASAATAANAVEELRDTLERWRQAWERKQLDEYTGFYGSVFAPPPDGDVTRWRARKQALFKQAGTIAVRIAAPSVFLLGDGTSAVTTFEQTYRLSASESRDFKVLEWRRQGDRWMISAETVLAGESGQQPGRRKHGG